MEYSLVFAGQVHEDFARNQVRRNIADLFRIQDQKVLDRMFSGEPCVLKKRLSEAKARKYLEVLLASGAICELRALTDAPGLPVGDEGVVSEPDSPEPEAFVAPSVAKATPVVAPSAALPVSDAESTFIGVVAPAPAPRPVAPAPQPEKALPSGPVLPASPARASAPVHPLSFELPKKEPLVIMAPALADPVLPQPVITAAALPVSNPSPSPAPAPAPAPAAVPFAINLEQDLAAILAGAVPAAAPVVNPEAAPTPAPVATRTPAPPPDGAGYDHADRTFSGLSGLKLGILHDTFEDHASSPPLARPSADAPDPLDLSSAIALSTQNLLAPATEAVAEAPVIAKPASKLALTPLTVVPPGTDSDLELDIDFDMSEKLAAKPAATPSFALVSEAGSSAAPKNAVAEPAPAPKPGPARFVIDAPDEPPPAPAAVRPPGFGPHIRPMPSADELPPEQSHSSVVVKGNGSGYANYSIMPEAVQGLCWGGFFAPWVWATFNGYYVSAGGIVLARALREVMPYWGVFLVLNLPFGLLLLFFGRQVAWKNKIWDSEERFNTVQRRWSIGGFFIFVLLSFGALANYRLTHVASQPLNDEDQLLLQKAQAAMDQPDDPAGDQHGTSGAGSIGRDVYLNSIKDPVERAKRERQLNEAAARDAANAASPP